MHMPIHGVCTKHGSVAAPHSSAFIVAESRRERYVVLLAGERIPHNELVLVVIGQDGEAVAAAQEAPLVTGVMALRQEEAGGRDAVGRFQNGREKSCCTNEPCEEAQQRRLPVVLAKAAYELGVGDDAAPWLAHRGCSREGRWLRREAEEDLLEEVIVV
jgi:hypothetical protein